MKIAATRKSDVKRERGFELGKGHVLDASRSDEPAVHRRDQSKNFRRSSESPRRVSDTFVRALASTTLHPKEPVSSSINIIGWYSVFCFLPYGIGGRSDLWPYILSWSGSSRTLSSAICNLAIGTRTSRNRRYNCISFSSVRPFGVFLVTPRNS